ncbi:MAG: hypothetical protein ABIU58_09090 [Ramlibacter sp.]
MSLLSWLFPAQKPAKSSADSSGLSRMESTRPVAGGNGKEASHGHDNARPANRKGERMARRELLYTVVRENMSNAGVLSASYKFKVLSLDARGRQFLVMVDLARDNGGETTRLAEIEALIAQSAKNRHDILVTAVYWRTSEHVAVGNLAARPVRAATSRPAPLDSQPGALDSRPAPLVSQAAAPVTPAAPNRSRYEPIQADEVAAFKRALAAGATNPAAAAAASVGVAHGATARSFDGTGKHGPQSYTLLTGFEDTEMSDADMRAPLLSGTQYGDLN